MRAAENPKINEVAKKHHRPLKNLAPTEVTTIHSPRVMNRWLSLLLIVAWALALRAPIAHIPLDRDEGEYAYIAQRSLQGDIPYKTSFDQKPPGTFLIYALIERYVGTSAAAIHWGTQVYTLGTLALVFFLGEKLFSGGVGLLAALLLALMVADPTVTGNSSNTEIFMIFPLTGALYTTLLAEESASIAWGFVTGLLLALSCLFKQVALMNGAFILLYLTLKSSKRMALTLSVVAGAGILFLVPIAYFHSVGAWQEFYDCVIGFNLNYATSLPLASYPQEFWQTFFPQLKTFWPVCILVILGIASGVRRRSSFRLLLGWLLFSFGGVMLGGYFRGHYFMQILPAVALLASGQLVALIRQRWPRHLFSLSAAALGLIIGFAVWTGSWYYGRTSPEEKSRRLYGKNPFAESVSVGHYLADHSGPEDHVFVFGSEPQILYDAGRPSASR